MRVNGIGTYNVVMACRGRGGAGACQPNEVLTAGVSPLSGVRRPLPVNPYGYSKFVAEQVVERFAPQYAIARTAWLYGLNGVNFIHKILQRARAGRRARRHRRNGSPTYVCDLADGIARLVELERPGVFHLVNAGACSATSCWEIVRLAGLTLIEPITSDAFKRASTPPPYAPLDNVRRRAGREPPMAGGTRQYIRERIRMTNNPLIPSSSRTGTGRTPADLPGPCGRPPAS